MNVKIKILSLSVVIAIVIIGGIIFYTSSTVVGTGEVGVLVKFGDVVDKSPLDAGFHFKSPLNSVVKIPIKVMKIESDQSGASKDLQNVKLKLAINYNVERDSAKKLYENVGKNYEDTVLSPAISESIKAIVSKFTAESLITNRSEVGLKATELLASKMLKYGINIVDFNITNFEFSKGFDEAIEAKQIAEQNVLKEKQEYEKVKIEAQKTVEKAKAEADALRLQKKEITAELLELRKIETQLEAIKKWDGKLPTYSGSAIPFLDINK